MVGCWLGYSASTKIISISLGGRGIGNAQPRVNHPTFMPYNIITKKYDLATKICKVCKVKFKCRSNAQKYCVPCGKIEKEKDNLRYVEYCMTKRAKHLLG